jgi:hypothetical protein
MQVGWLRTCPMNFVNTVMNFRISQKQKISYFIELDEKENSSPITAMILVEITSSEWP